MVIVRWEHSAHSLNGSLTVLCSIYKVDKWSSFKINFSHSNIPHIERLRHLINFHGCDYDVIAFVFCQVQWIIAIQFSHYSTVLALIVGSGFGITAGAHRLWSHKAYKATWQLRLLLTFLFTISGQVSHIYSAVWCKAIISTQFHFPARCIYLGARSSCSS